MHELLLSGQPLLDPVVKEAPLCLPSSGARSRFLFGVARVEEVFVFVVAACLFDSSVCFLSCFSHGFCWMEGVCAIKTTFVSSWEFFMHLRAVHLYHWVYYTTQGVLHGASPVRHHEIARHGLCTVPPPV